jgi:hypothetical protein
MLTFEDCLMNVQNPPHPWMALFCTSVVILFVFCLAPMFWILRAAKVVSYCPQPLIYTPLSFAYPFLQTGGIVISWLI